MVHMSTDQYVNKGKMCDHVEKLVTTFTLGQFYFSTQP